MQKLWILVIELIVPPETGFFHTVKRGYTALAYIIEGEILAVNGEREVSIGGRSTAIFDPEGGVIYLRTSEKPARVLCSPEGPLASR